MDFQSFRFLFFVLASLIAFYAVPSRFRVMILLSCSLAFYGYYYPRYLLLMTGLAALNYSAAIGLGRPKSKNSSAWIYLLALCLNIGLLAFYKYSAFLEINFNRLAGVLGWNYSLSTLKLLVPLGLSFIIFQLISYLNDVKRGKIQAERNFGIFLLYVSWFPKVISGPIERADQLLPQFRVHKRIEYQYIGDAFRQILWGFFQKLVIADRLEVITSPVFDNPNAYSGLSIMVGVIFYSLQIYADFAGYTHIALGVSQLFGIKLTQNFRTPYFSRSIQEFWTRWHITLSHWLRDYLFLPLSFAFSRKMPKNTYLGISTDYWIYGFASILTMLICGIWHGAGWNFVGWGLLHGLYLVSGFVLKKPKREFNKFLGWKKDNKFRIAWDILFTFLLVSFAWIFFRSANLAGANTMIDRLFLLPHWLNSGIINDLPGFKITLILLMLWITWEWFHQSCGSIYGFSQLKPIVRWPIYLILFWSIIIFGQFGNERFIYFQF